jgi:hypothetical protein
MIGFIKGLFNSQPKAVETDVQPEVTTPVQKPSAYFLAADDALTLGNIDYMRTAKSVKKTFPKVASLQEKTAEPMVTTDSFGKATEVAAVEMPQVSSVSDAELAERRRSASELDMFRNMARDLKKP